MTQAVSSAVIRQSIPILARSYEAGAAGWGTAMVSSSRASAYGVHRNTVPGTCKGSRGGWGSAMVSNMLFR